MWGQNGDAGWPEQNVAVSPLWECVLHENTMRKGVGEYLFCGWGVADGQEPVTLCGRRRVFLSFLSLN